MARVHELNALRSSLLGITAVWITFLPPRTARPYRHHEGFARERGHELAFFALLALAPIARQAHEIVLVLQSALKLSALALPRLPHLFDQALLIFV